MIESKSIVVTEAGIFFKEKQGNPIDFYEEIHIITQLLIRKFNDSFIKNTNNLDSNKEHLNALLNELKTDLMFGGRGDMMSNQYFLAIDFMINDINNACNRSAKYVPLSSKMKKEISQLHQLFFPTSPGFSFFSCNTSDYRRERIEFMQIFFAENFTDIKWLCKRWDMLNALDRTEKKSNHLQH